MQLPECCSWSYISAAGQSYSSPDGLHWEVKTIWGLFRADPWPPAPAAVPSSRWRTRACDRTGSGTAVERMETCPQKVWFDSLGLARLFFSRTSSWGRVGVCGGSRGLCPAQGEVRAGAAAGGRCWGGAAATRQTTASVCPAPL